MSILAGASAASRIGVPIDHQIVQSARSLEGDHRLSLGAKRLALRIDTTPAKPLHNLEPAEVRHRHITVPPQPGDNLGQDHVHQLLRNARRNPRRMVADLLRQVLAGYQGRPALLTKRFAPPARLVQ
jgi:hypothetical protein